MQDVSVLVWKWKGKREVEEERSSVLSCPCTPLMAVGFCNAASRSFPRQGTPEVRGASRPSVPGKCDPSHSGDHPPSDPDNLSAAYGPCVPVLKLSNQNPPQGPISELT
jgi:hypothetical protein